MKFPIAFRVFAVLNLLIFFVLAIVTAMVLLQPSPELFWMALTGCFVAVWFLTSSLFWLLGSDRAYPFLYFSALAGLAFTVSIVFITLSPASNIGKDGLLVVFVFVLIAFLYSLFLFIALFFKSVKEWVNDSTSPRNKFDLLTSGGFVVLAVIVSSTFIYIDKSLPRSITIDSTYNSYVGSNGCSYFYLNALTEFDRVRVTRDNASPGIVVVMFADNYGSDESGFFRSDTVAFFEDGPDYLVARFDPVWARKVVFCATNSNFSPAGVDLLHSVPYFAGNLDTEKYFVREGSEEVPIVYEYDTDEGYEDEVGDYSDEAPRYPEFEEETGPKALDSLGRSILMTELLTQLKRPLAEGSGNFYFNFDNGSYELDGVTVGAYTHFRTLFKDHTGEGFYRYAEQRHPESEAESLNSVLVAISGFNLYQNREEVENLPFDMYNPPLLQWVGNNMLPEPEEEFFGVKSQTVYDITFRRMVWMLAASYEYVATERNWDHEALRYKEAFTEQTFYGPTYLYERFADPNFEETPFNKVYQEFDLGEYDYSYLTEQIAIGFWLRRKLDGSSEEVYEMLTKILEKYDSYTWG